MKATTAPRTSACAHHWVIDTADGPTSNGRCKKCGVAKDFLNSFDALVELNELLKEQAKPELVASA